QPAASGEDGEKEEAEKREREWAEAERGRREDECEDHALPLQRPCCAERGREPERVAIQTGEEGSRCANAERPARPGRVVSPPAPCDRGEEQRGHDRSREHERQVPDQGRRQVIEEAVRGERVVAGVPVVVPQQCALANEERAVEVDSRISWRRS